MTAEASILQIDHCAPRLLTTSDLEQHNNQKIKRARDKRWEVIEPLVTGKNAVKMLFPHERAALVAERAKVEFPHGNNGCMRTYSRQSIYSFVYLWWRGGQTQNALLGKYQNCGAPGKARVQNVKKLGRRSKITAITDQSTGIVLSSYWMNIICLGSLLFFNSQKIGGLRAAYRDTLRHFCPKGKVRNQKGEWEIIIPDYTKGEVFSPRQFNYHVRRHVEKDLQEFFYKKFGKRKFNLRFRELKGNSTSEAPYPGAIYQIDATIADVNLVSRLNRTRIIGRPVITVIIDVFSRMIVGVCVRMEREGWNVISLALKNATEDKVTFCKKYGVEITESDWPVIGLCDAVVGDRGPMKGYNANNLVTGLGISVSTLPPYRADWKGIVEQMFRLMNIRVIKQLPGALNPERERGDRDVRLDAVLDIEQFTAIVIKAILYHNNHHYMSAYPMDRDMITAGVKPIPRELFIWGRENRSGTPRHKEPEAIRVHLLPGGEATVTPRGIRFKGEFYTCQLAEDENWRFIARNRGAWKENIAYDPRLPGIIYLRPAGLPSIPCHLMDPESIAAKADMAEIEEYRERKNIDDQRAEVTNVQGRVNLDAGIDDIVAQAQEICAEARAQAPVESKSSRLSNINENRQAEIDKMNEEYRRDRLEELGIFNPERTSITSPPDTGEEHIPRPRFSNVLSIQERKMKQHGEKK
ncbi:MAG: hypothetical protein QOE33_872 [Acidobacteriota bacterium]|nr:hypothetical protein [Acidobacteriota bacterium]